MLAIIDYGAGNIFSVKNALDFLKIPNMLTKKREEIRSADRIILPGVGAFPNAMRMLEESKLVDILRDEAQKKPFLGICLGMQLLFDKGYEFEETQGLALIDGTVEKLMPGELLVPHIGWNQLALTNPCPLLNGVDGAYVYFVHSYKAVSADENIAAVCSYGEDVPAVVARGKVFGTQFHPEKSGRAGLQILQNFANLI